DSRACGIAVDFQKARQKDGIAAPQVQNAAWLGTLQTHHPKQDFKLPLAIGNDKGPFLEKSLSDFPFFPDVGGHKTSPMDKMQPAMLFIGGICRELVHGLNC